MKRLLIPNIVFAITLWVAGPAFAQRGSGAGGNGRPAGVGAPSGVGGGADLGRGAGGPTEGMPSHNTGAENAGSTNLAHSSPSDVLSHNTVIAGKISGLTSQDAQSACNGFKNLGQCVAAAHVAKNLDIPGGFDALKSKMTGPNAVSLGKAIQGLKPEADAKAEAKKANKQSNEDLKRSS